MPLVSIALGLVVVLASVPTAGGYDVLADPLGWALVVAGVAGLTGSRRRGLLIALAVVAGAVSVVLWLPEVREQVVSADPAVTWSINLPQVAFIALLLWDLRDHARASDPPAGRTLTGTTVLVVAVGLAPAVVLGGGLDTLAAGLYVLAGFVLLTVVVLLFAYSRRDWVPRRHQPTA